MLKFDTFQESPIVEGLTQYIDMNRQNSLEYNSIPIPQNPQNTNTYLDEYSMLVKNEQKLVAIGADFSEHLDALNYCNLITFNAKNNSTMKYDNDQIGPLKYTITNKYLNDPTDKTNEYIATNNTIPKRCPTIKNWEVNKNEPLYNGTIDLNFDTKNFGKNMMTDLSYINVLLTTSNKYVNDISNNYKSQIPQGSSYDDIITMYNKNVELRRSLDNKMIELYNGDQSIAMYQKKSMDSVVYANILWTVLATSLIYYVFVKI
jgi:hypothetical protein